MKTNTVPVGAGTCVAEAPHLLFARPILTTLKQRLLPLFAVATLSAAALAQPVELLENSNFSAGLDHWVLPADLAAKNWNPLEGGEVNLHPPFGMTGYQGDVIYQPLNVPGAGDKTVTAMVRLRRSFADPADRTIAVFIEYVTTANQLERVLAFEVLNSAVTDVEGESTLFQAPVNLPANARKLTKFGLSKQTWGSLYAVEASLVAEDLVPGPVPRITQVTGSGVFGAVMTVSGTNLGNTPGLLLLGGSAALITPESWADTSVQARVQEPAKAGDVRVVQDFTESWDGAEYTITSPTLELVINQPRQEVIRGSTATFVVQADFFNGFASAAGVTFTVPQAPLGIASFSPLPLRNSGGVLLSIATGGLPEGTYEWTVQSVEADSAPRTVPITLVVHQVASVTFYHNSAPVTSLNINQQGEIHLGFELFNSAGDLLPSMDCQYSSSAPALLLALTHTSNGAFRVFAHNEGSANLILSAPDGFSATLPVNISGLSSQRMTSASFTNLYPNNSGESSTRFAASSLVGINGWGQEGWLATSPYLSEAFAAFSFGSTSAQSDSFSIEEGQMPNVFLFSASSPGGSHYTALTVVNAPNLGAIAGQVNSLDEFGYHGAEGLLEFFDPEDDSGPLFERNISNYHSASFLTGAIPPGNYKVRLFSAFSATEQWFPNTVDFDSAQVLTFAAGTTQANIDFFTPPPQLRFTTQPRDQLVPVNSPATFVAQVSGFEGPFTFQWQENGIDLSDGPKFAGTGTGTLTIEDCQLGDSTKLYTVVVTDTNLGRIVSRQALLTVGDFDPPDVTTLASTHPEALIRALRAVVPGQVNANGAPTNIIVRWGLTSAALSQSVAASPAVVTGSDPVFVTANLTGLSPNTTYFYQFQAVNSTGPTSGSIQSFTTPVAVPPVVQTLPVGNTTHDSALLLGTVNPGGEAALVVFEFGPTNALGQSVMANPHTVTGNTVQTVSAALAPLLPHTTYHYRIRVVSDNGAANGTVRTFTTSNRDVIALDDTRALLPSSQAYLNVLANDSDPDGDELRVHSFTQTPKAVGRVARAGNDLMFTPASTFNGGNFTYTVTDGFGSFATANVTLTRAACAISPSVWTLTAASGSHDVDVTTSAPWSVVAAPGWISSPSGGVGSGVATLHVAPNTSNRTRTGVVLIGGEVHTVTQDGVLSPAISVPDVIPLGIVSGDYQLAIPTLNPPVTYAVSGLPPGISMNQATGVLLGKPRRQGAFPVKIRARNRAGSSQQIEFTLLVDDLPDHAKGSFGAVIARDFTVGDNMGGTVSFVTTPTGSYSGLLRVAADTVRIRGWLDTSVAGPVRLNVNAPRRNAPAIILNLEISDSASGSLTNGTAMLDIASSPAAEVEGASHPWNARNRATDFAANFNFALSPEDEDNEAAPQGHGYLMLRALVNGRVTWSGKLADGTGLSGSSALWGNGAFPVYVPLYRGLGSLHGLAEVGATPDPDDRRAIRDAGGDLTWLKLPQNARAYPNGFVPLALQVDGSQYLSPLRGEIVMDLMDVDPGDTNASIDFAGGGIDDTDFGSSLAQDFRVMRTHRTIFTNDAFDNPGKVRITRLNPANGMFTGTFTLVDENPDRNFQLEFRRVTFQGLILPNRGEGLGFFNLGELSSPPIPQARMPQRSGGVRFN